jgi:hypothetical protein
MSRHFGLGQAWVGKRHPKDYQQMFAHESFRQTATPDLWLGFQVASTGAGTKPGQHYLRNLPCQCARPRTKPVPNFSFPMHFLDGWLLARCTLVTCRIGFRVKPARDVGAECHC